jgi:hypothetical protein
LLEVETMTGLISSFLGRLAREEGVSLPPFETVETPLPPSENESENRSEKVAV